MKFGAGGWSECGDAEVVQLSDCGSVGWNSCVLRGMSVAWSCWAVGASVLCGVSAEGVGGLFNFLVGSV